MSANAIYAKPRASQSPLDATHEDIEAGRRFAAAEAKTLGLIDAVVPQLLVDRAVRYLARLLAFFR